MRLDRPFIRLPIRVDAAALAAEVAAIPVQLWRAHPEAAAGNTAVPLVCRHGNPDDERANPPMAAAPILSQLPQVRSAMAALGAPIGRSRLMRIESGGTLGSHVDTNRYWQEHLRVHIPVITDSSVRFTCGGESVHMAPGEVWVFDTWREHGVENPAGHDRIHLVIDTVGSSSLWRAIIDGTPFHGGGGSDDELRYERNTEPALATPWQQAQLAQGLIADLAASRSAPAIVADAASALSSFVDDYRAAWYAHDGGDHISPDIVHVAERLRTRLAHPAANAELPNGLTVGRAAEQLLLAPNAQPSSNPIVPANRRPPSRSRRRIERPIFIVSPPRSGSTLLFETLARAAGLYTIGGESHRVIESIAGLHPASHEWNSNALAASDATPPVVRQLDEAFAAQSRDRDGRAPAGVAPIRLLEKTPKNALRVPFLAAVYPDASFVYLHRQPEPAIGSIIDAWISGRFVTYRELPGWPGTWSLLLIPGWQHLLGDTIAHVAAEQWATTTAVLLNDLGALDADRVCVVSHEQLLADPDGECRRIAERLGLVWDRPIVGPLPLSSTTLEPPRPDKWKRHEPEIDGVRWRFASVAERAAAMVAERGRANQAAPAGTDRAEPVAEPVVERSRSMGSAEMPGAVTYSSAHTASVAALLERANASLIVTTYQAGRVILVRSDGDGRLNTHLRAFRRPMGVAARPGAVALGTDEAVIEFRDQPALAARLPGHRHDTCYVPRFTHVTGDISIHEMAWAADGELWIVNTRFSCLVTLDRQHSFVPRWRPAFVTGYNADDRCHLNGLAMVDGAPRYVTAMGITDEPNGWRAGKIGGGVVIDVDDDAIVATGLTMPHSPRWHRGQLWVLDSGHGFLSRVDLTSGVAEPVVRLPGFTRGLAFIGPYALVGLSKVREHVFAGLPLAEHVAERRSGVWVVDIDSGEIVGMLRFEGDVDEVFDLQVLAGQPYPELLEPNDPLATKSFVVPDAVLSEMASQATR